MGILEGPRPVSGPPATRFGMRHLSLISVRSGVRGSLLQSS